MPTSMPGLMLPRASEILQNGYVVDDLKRAIDHWLALGVGPFLRLEVEIDHAIYRGSSEPLRGAFALAQAGGIQIELIQPLGGRPSAYRDSVPPGTTAFHHVMKIAKDWDAEMRALRAAGFAVANEASLEGLRFAYIDTRDAIGCMFELVEDGNLIRSINSAVKQAAEGWDGRDAVRRYDPAA